MFSGVFSLWTQKRTLILNSKKIARRVIASLTQTSRMGGPLDVWVSGVFHNHSRVLLQLPISAPLEMCVYKRWVRLFWNRCYLWWSLKELFSPLCFQLAPYYFIASTTPVSKHTFCRFVKCVEGFQIMNFIIYRNYSLKERSCFCLPPHPTHISLLLAWYSVCDVWKWQTSYKNYCLKRDVFFSLVFHNHTNSHPHPFNSIGFFGFCNVYKV